MEFLYSIDEFIRLNASEFNENDVASLLWGCSILKHKPPSNSMKSIENTVLKNMSNYSDRALVSSIWSIIRIKHRPSESFLCTFDSEVVKRTLAANPSGVKDFFLALSKFCYAPSKELLILMDTKISHCLDEFSIEVASSLICCFAKTNHVPSRSLLDSFENKIGPLLNILKPADFCAVMRAFIRFKHSLATGTMRQIDSTMRYKLGTFNNRLLIDVIFSYPDVVNPPSKAVFDSIVKLVLLRLSEFSSNEFTVLLQALVKLKVLPSHSFVDTLNMELDKREPSFDAMTKHRARQSLNILCSQMEATFT